jgi:hypothetical protein
MMVVRIANGLPEGIQKALGRSHIRVSQPQVDYIAPFFFHLGKAHVHLGSEITLEQV